MELTKIFRNFINSEKSGGIVLIICTVLSIVITNTAFGEAYSDFWHIKAGSHSLEHWINDGLMAVFFLLIGLELERELYGGELSKIKNAALPVVAAAGGMIVPAVIYLLFNYGAATQSGAGIPMATDIAFSIGILSLLGRSIPVALKVFLTAFAIIDDLGAIIIIALFYSGEIDLQSLGISFSVFLFLLALNRLKVYNLIPYLLGGVFMWYYMLQSGVHATISGVMLAFAIPYGSGRAQSPSYILQNALHKTVAWGILPLFALANTAIVLENDWYTSMQSSLSLGIMSGLVAGKPIGILLFSFISVAAGICSLPSGVKWKHIAGAGFLGGIGFTMSIFISLLAFNDSAMINQSKIAVLVSSLIAGITGYIFLFAASRRAHAVKRNTY